MTGVEKKLKVLNGVGNYNQATNYTSNSSNSRKMATKLNAVHLVAVPDTQYEVMVKEVEQVGGKKWKGSVVDKFGQRQAIRCNPKTKEFYEKASKKVIKPYSSTTGDIVKTTSATGKFSLLVQNDNTLTKEQKAELQRDWLNTVAEGYKLYGTGKTATMSKALKSYFMADLERFKSILMAMLGDGI